MKFLILSMVTLFSASALAEICPSVDRVLQNAARGVVELKTPYDFSPGAAIASATLCHIEKSGFKMCETRIGLIKDLIAAGRASFEVGETTLDVVENLEAKLSRTKLECRK